MLRAFRRLVGTWYVSSALTIAVGLVVGYFIFFNIYPGRPEIAVIDIPFTEINDRSSAFIAEMLDYAGGRNSVKAVVVKLDSPGGSVGPSDLLFLKMVRLREKKPVVVVTRQIAASGGFLMAMGANYIYAHPSTFVGSVGVILFTPTDPRPDERIVTTGPAKITGGSTRTFISMAETIKENFVSTVVAQRGDRLRITPQEISEARLYLGSDAVRAGLVDALGTDDDAIAMAARLAGISNYDLLKVNERVLEDCIRTVQRIIEPLDSGQVDVNLPGVPCATALFPAERSRFPRSGADSDLLSRAAIPEMLYLYVTPSE